MNPQDALKRTMFIQEQMAAAKSSGVKVGVISSKVGGAVYNSGMTVLDIAAAHEYGLGVPRRSFLRTPFLIKKNEINEFIGAQFTKIVEGKMTTDKALGRVGIFATNIVKGAFTSKGYGQWEDITEETKAAKGSSQILIDTGTLRNSITYEVE